MVKYGMDYRNDNIGITYLVVLLLVKDRGGLFGWSFGQSVKV